MGLQRTPVDSHEVDDISLTVDLPDLAGQQVKSPSDIEELLDDVDDSYVAEFVANWLNEEATSGEFIPAVRHIMYASTMLSIASELITAADQEVEYKGNGENPLCVVEMIAEALAARGHTPEAQQLMVDKPDLAEALQHQLFGDHAKALRDISGSLEPVLEANRLILDDTSKPMTDRLKAAGNIEKITNLLESINPKETQEKTA